MTLLHATFDIPSNMSRISRIAGFTFIMAISLSKSGGETPLPLGEEVQIRRSDSGIEVVTAPKPNGHGGRAVISLVSFEAYDSSPRSFVVSGRVVSDNTMTGIERVLIRVGDGSDVPVVAGMTNVDGDFKFRLWIDEDDYKLVPEVAEPFVGYLYVGGAFGDLAASKSEANRPLGTIVRRYKLAELYDHSKSKQQ